jgi:hypothetical protein
MRWCEYVMGDGVGWVVRAMCIKHCIFRACLYMSKHSLRINSTSIAGTHVLVLIVWRLNSVQPFAGCMCMHSAATFEFYNIGPCVVNRTSASRSRGDMARDCDATAAYQGDLRGA